MDRQPDAHQYCAANDKVMRGHRTTQQGAESVNASNKEVRQVPFGDVMALAEKISARFGKRKKEAMDCNRDVPPMITDSEWFKHEKTLSHMINADCCISQTHNKFVVNSPIDN